MTRSRQIPDQSCLLLVDDDPTVLASINDSLRDIYQTRVANCGARALELALRRPLPDLILLDIEMTGMDGYEVCRRLKEDPHSQDIPVIFLSSHRDVPDITRGLELGAVDFVTKPIVLPILLARVRTHLRLQEVRSQLHDHNIQLEAQVAERTAALQAQTREVLKGQEMTIIALGSLAETRDNETGNHIRRTQEYVRQLCDEVRFLPRWKAAYDADGFSLIWKSAPLHDIGKVGIPDAILLKPGKLTNEEFEQMKQHTVLGRRALDMAIQQVSSEQSFLSIASQIAYHHHERWDGAGYPDRLAGESIPLPARMMAIADVYDALVSKRVYKAPMPHHDAIELLRQGRGTQFDPNLIDIFLTRADQMKTISDTFADH